MNEPKKPGKIYLSGPMRGLPDWNRPAFAEAKDRLEEAGYQVFSPAACAEAYGYNPSCPSEPHDGGIDHLRHVILGDVACILFVDAIALLP